MNHGAAVLRESWRRVILVYGMVLGLRCGMLTHAASCKCGGDVVDESFEESETTQRKFHLEVEQRVKDGRCLGSSVVSLVL